MHMSIDCTIVIFKLHVTPQKPISYKSLLNSALRKLRLPLDSDIRMKYKANQFVINIIDVDNLEEFFTNAINNAPIELYNFDSVGKVVGIGSNQPSSSSNYGFQ